MTEPTSQWVEMVALRGARVLTVIVVALIFARVLKALTLRLVDLAKSPSRSALMREQHTKNLARILYTAGAWLIFIVAVLVVLPDFGFNITPLAAAAGLASLALGFGGQHLVKDIINGFFILFENQYIVGDTIRLNGETGSVEEITLRRTLLRNERGAMVTIPNGLVGQVANLSRDWSQIFVDVSISSKEAAGRALAALEKVSAELRADPAWSGALVDGPRVLGVESLAPESTLMRIQVRTPALRQDDVARELRRRIRAAFEQAQILVAQTHYVETASRPSPPV